MREYNIDFFYSAAAWASSQVNNITSAVIAAGIVIAFAQIYGLGRVTLENSRDKHVWGLRKPKEVRIVSGSVDHSDPFVKAPTAWPDANAASILIQKCKEIYPSARVTHGFQCGPDEMIGDLVAVGGPVQNEATRELMRHIGDAIAFTPAQEADPEDRYTLVVNGDSYTPEFDGPRLLRDFGAIVRMRNPLSSHNNDTILVLGCETFGVLAAALVLADDEVAHGARKALEKKLPVARRKIDFVAVFSCQPLEFSVGAVRLEYFRRLDGRFSPSQGRK